MRRGFRSPVVRDAALAVVLAAVEVVSVVVAGPDGTSRTPAVGYLLLAASNLPLVVRRRWPVPVWAVIGTATAVYGWADWVDPPVFAGMLVALYTVGAYVPRRTAIAVGGATIAVSVVGFLTDPAPNDLNDLLTPVLVTVTALLVGATVAAERRTVSLLEQRAEQLVRERDAEAERVVSEERLRIARELHDVTAHHVAVIAVQAEAGQSLLPTRVDEANGAFEAISSSARAAMADLRRVLGVLRRDPSPALREPQPGLTDVPRLAEQVRLTGLHVDVAQEGTPADVPDTVDLSAFRVVQEALTNVIKHADATEVRVALRYRPGAVEVEVVDDGTGPAPSPDGPGQGLTGMRERVELLGGVLLAAPVDDGPGFRVRATLPT